MTPSARKPAAGPGLALPEKLPGNKNCPAPRAIAVAEKIKYALKDNFRNAYFKVETKFVGKDVHVLVSPNPAGNSGNALKILDLLQQTARVNREKYPSLVITSGFYSQSNGSRLRATIKLGTKGKEKYVETQSAVPKTLADEINAFKDKHGLNGVGVITLAEYEKK